MVVVRPSFGFGNWDESGGVEAVERARAWAVAMLGANEARIFLVGLSNGGTGVTRAAAATPGAYRGLIFLSGVLEEDVLLDGQRKGDPLGLPPILVVHGRDDDRVPLADVTSSLRHLRAHGATIDEQILDGQDHFLFFDRDEDVLGRVEEWVKQVHR
jgi:predicted esterase